MTLGPGCYPDIPMSAYLADPCDRPSLSASAAHLLNVTSAKHVWAWHSRLGNLARPKTTESQSDGSLVHAMVLENGRGVCVIDADDFRTKQARTERDAALARGWLPVTRVKHSQLSFAVDGIKADIADIGIDIWSGTIESTLVWEEDGILCRCRPDSLLLSDDLIIDLKTCDSAAPDDAARAFGNYGYDVSAAAYISAVEHLYPERAGRVRKLFLFAELEPPYVVTPIVASGSMLELGQRKWQRAKEIWKRCLESGDWPPYSRTPVAVEPPIWELQKAGMS